MDKWEINGGIDGRMEGGIDGGIAGGMEGGIEGNTFETQANSDFRFDFILGCSEGIP